MDAEVLPGNDHSPVHPFLSLVINLNVTTIGHRDKQDKGLCVVLALGDFEGGDLCLYEPGLVLSLQNGHFVAFPSNRVTHVNLHVTGRRASIVLHTDKRMEDWTDGERNGWRDNMYFM